MPTRRFSLLLASLTLVWGGIALADSAEVAIPPVVVAEVASPVASPTTVPTVVLTPSTVQTVTPKVARRIKSSAAPREAMPAAVVSQSVEPTSPSTRLPTPAPVATPTPVPSVAYRIEGPDGVLSGDIPVTGGHVGQVTQAIAQKHGTTFAYDTSDVGWFVLELAGVKNEPRKGRYWLFEVNGKFSEKGVDQIFLRPGDTLVWRY